MTMEGGLVGTVEVDSKDANPPDNPIGRLLSGLVKAIGHTDMTLTVDPTGDISDAKVAEATIKKLKEMPKLPGMGGEMFGVESLKGLVRGNIIVPLPKEAVAKGKSWTEKSDQQSSLGRIKSVVKYTYEGPVEKGGQKLEKIAVKPDQTKIVPREKAPLQMTTKSSKGKGAVLFDNTAGHIAEASNEMTVEAQVEAFGQTIDTTMTATTSIRLKTGAKTTAPPEKK